MTRHGMEPARQPDEAAATPRPWRRLRAINCASVIDADGFVVAAISTYRGDKADDGIADLIVLAVNNHDPLVETLRELIEAAGNPPTELLMRAEVALAAAEGECAL